MKYIIISFKTRNSLLGFIKIARQNGIFVDIINTPHIISKGCGLSGKTIFSNLNIVKNLVKQIENFDFVGIFCLERDGFQERLQRLY